MWNVITSHLIHSVNTAIGINSKLKDLSQCVTLTNLLSAGINLSSGIFLLERIIGNNRVLVKMS